MPLRLRGWGGFGAWAAVGALLFVAGAVLAGIGFCVYLIRLR